MEEEQKDIKYVGLLNTDYNYLVTVKENSGKTFYNILLKNTSYDGQKIEVPLRVYFSKCEPVTNGTYIRVKKATEYWRKNPNDKFNFIVYVVIFDYEVAGESRKDTQQALNEFNNTTYSEDDLPY